MKKRAVFTLFFSCLIGSIMAQHHDAITITSAKFIIGTNDNYQKISFDDSQWKSIKTGELWQSQGYADSQGYAWYRIHVVIPSSIKENSAWKDSLRIFLARINDVDETFFNEVRIGKTGSFPNDPEAYMSKWSTERSYFVPVSSPIIKWDADNVIAIKVYDGDGSGGIFMGKPFVDILEKTDGILLSIPSSKIEYLPSERTVAPLTISNSFDTTTKGVLSYNVFDEIAKKEIISKNEEVVLLPFAKKEIKLNIPNQAGIEIRYVFKESTSKATPILEGKITVPYILTPAVSLYPRINSAKVFGVRPGSPFLFKIAVTGQKPLQYAISGLPKGLTLDKETGIIKGVLNVNGDFVVKVKVSNALGNAKQNLLLKVGDGLALTPPMGWNSWNSWGISVSEEKVKSSAQALIDNGLLEHGWTYVNIDDGWQAPKRSSDSIILANKKFPDMKKLGDWLHDKGLKFGIYSSPGPKTCGGYLGSYQNEQNDADSYTSWGVDYLKYDWCTYREVVKDTTLQSSIKPFEVMQKALRSQKRDIVYSLVQYGMKEVWKWGDKVDGNLWRTTIDMEDTWESLYSIGFQQASLYPYAKPGRWNDPDMMIVGRVGWGENLHDTRLTPDEQYTHVSLWSMLSAPLLIGCDLSNVDPFTLNLLTNDEVLAIDQDVLGKQAKQLIKNDKYQVWVKELADGTQAVAIFNMDTVYQEIKVNWEELGIKKNANVRDIWKQKDLGVFKFDFSKKIPPHGVVMLKIN